MRLPAADSVRARLTAFYVIVLALALVLVGGLIYVLLARALYARIDEGLLVLLHTSVTSLANDLDEGQSAHGAAQSTAAELSSRQRMLAIYDSRGQLLAEGGRDDDLEIVLPSDIPEDDPLLVTVLEARDDDDRHRLAMRRFSMDAEGADYIIVAGAELESIDEELESLRGILAYVVPLALLVAGGGGWFLIHRSLSPIAVMADRARQMSAGDPGARLPVANPRDELGRLATAFNEVLARLDASLTQQRQFMADASHELRTPVATTRTAAAVALQRPHRPEEEYREALRMVELQATRLSRIVEDMFTLARADTGSYPVRRVALYLDEVAQDAVSAARVLAARRDVTIELDSAGPAPLEGDEDLLRRLVLNLLDNAVRHSPRGGTVHVALRREEGRYLIEVRDQGPGVPEDARSSIFERFYRVDRARTRSSPDERDGAGLGLPLARWIARTHGGDVELTHSSAAGAVFTAWLPARAARASGAVPSA